MVLGELETKRIVHAGEFRVGYWATYRDATDRGETSCGLDPQPCAIGVHHEFHATQTQRLMSQRFSRCPYSCRRCCRRPRAHPNWCVNPSNASPRVHP